MTPAIALPAPRRLTDLLSSPTPVRAKRSREAMEQPRIDEDQALVARAQSGDAAAFDDLVVKYSPRLYGLVYNMTSNHEDTNDLLQDVFSKAYKSIGGFRGKSSFYTWIHSIAVNMTLNFLKKRVRDHFLIDQLVELHRCHLQHLYALAQLWRQYKSLGEAGS